MKKLSIFSIISVIILAICCNQFPIATVYASEQDLSSKSACLVDYATKEVLFEKNSHSKMPIASMVKMMTTLLTIEDIDAGNITLDEMITTSENASGMGGSQVFIDPYVEYSVEDLLKSVIVASANDASVALAEHISGSESNFVKRMNKRAKELGMNDTNYVNCTGLPAAEGYSSAYDCAIILRELTSHNIYHNYSSIWMDDLVHPSGRKTGLTNTNRLIRYYEGCDGGKTGSTNEAGYCLSATAKRGDMRLLSVIIGAKDSQTRFNECAKLFNFGFSNFENVLIIDSNSKLGELNVSKGKLPTVDAYPCEDFYALVKKNEDNPYSTSLQLPDIIKAPLKANECIGKIIVSKNGVIIKEISVVTNQDVEKMSFTDTLRKIGQNW